jgi:hypothetical protein
MCLAYDGCHTEFPARVGCWGVSQAGPARAVPLLYLATAHVSLGLACFLAGSSRSRRPRRT